MTRRSRDRGAPHRTASKLTGLVLAATACQALVTDAPAAGPAIVEGQVAPAAVGRLAGGTSAASSENNRRRAGSPDRQHHAAARHTVVGGSSRPTAASPQPPRSPPHPLGGGSSRPTSAPPEPPCTHPHPCGGAWEGAGRGPFDLAEVREVFVESHDGVLLHGWLGFPDLPEAVVAAPVALHSSPYLGTCVLLAVPGERGCIPGPGDPSFWSDGPTTGVIRTWGVPPIELIRHGYVAAFFEVRGTGGSEGCFDWFGEDETRDQGVLVDWLATQEWSTGRVGMGGNSYPAGTAWQAAIQAPEGLKTIVTAGIFTDGYTWFHTPQGMQHALFTDVPIGTEAYTSRLPHAGGGAASLGELPRIAERAADCPPFAAAAEPAAGGFVRDRDRDFWEPRRYQHRLDQVRASVLLPHGLQDVTGHAFQDMLVWKALQDSGVRPRPPRLPCPPRAPSCTDPPLSPPMWQISGQWGHGPPFADTPALTPQWIRDNWSSILFDWLGYWLQGAGDPPPHRVDYQDTEGEWHTSNAWPPAEAHQEALYLDGDQLTTAPGDGDRRFVAATTPLGLKSGWVGYWAGPGSLTCRELLVAGVPEQATVYVSEPFTTDSLLAGNPFLYLELSSDRPGGLVEVALLRLPEGDTCDDPEFHRVVARGAADLGHHDGSYDHLPFPIGDPTPVRVDLFNNAVRFSPGDRLVLVVSGPDSYQFTAVSPHTPTITVHARSSHVVLPFVMGGLGGSPAGIDYPPNPAAPGAGSG